MSQLLISGYKIQYKISEGGMSEIWYAQNALQKPAAVKILKADLVNNPQAVQIFENEASVLAQLHHNFIRKVIDVGSADGRPAIVLEYLEGKTLDQYFKEGKEFTQDQLIHWWNEAVEVLQYIHRKNIIHNDITPANFFITEDEHLHLIDFGLSIEAGKINIAANGLQRMGSLRYLSPEVLQSPSTIQSSADSYSLAVSFYQLVSGKKPYAEIKDPLELQYKIVEELIPAHELVAPWSFLLEGYLYKNAYSRNSLHKIDINKAIDEDQTLAFTASPAPVVQPVQPVYAPYPEKKKSGNWFWTFLVIMIISALVAFAINEEKLMPYIQKWMGTKEPPKIEAKAPVENQPRPKRPEKKESNNLPIPQSTDTSNMFDEEDTNIKIIDIAQKELEVKTLINAYYNSRTDCDKMSDFFAPLVRQYYTKSNLTIQEVQQECNQYHNKWKFVEADITPSSYIYKHQNNGKTFVDFNVLYKIKQKEEDLWIPYNIDVSALVDNNNKIERIVEKRIEKL